MDRRQFTRIIFSTPATLTQKEKFWQTQLIDLSLKGALVNSPANWDLPTGSQLNIIFRLQGADIDIKMETHVAHVENDHLGLKCDHVDIDSATHLRRLIELNVGDDQLLHRELDLLSHPE